MEKLIAAFREHPASVGETYFEHMRMATSFGFAMMRAGLACLIHGLLPFLFTRTGRTTIESLHRRMVTHRDRRTAQADAPQPGPARTA